MIRPYFSRTHINADHVSAFFVSLAPLVFFFPAVRGQIFISPDDGIIFNVPLRVTAANLIRSGHIPLWNPYLFSGMPLHGAAQAGLLFPLNWFYLISSPPVATNLMMLATYMVAALGAYVYARRAGADRAGAIVTSLVWQFSAFLVEQVGHTNVLHTAAMLPWVLWAVERYISNYARGRGVILAALIAIQVFAGHQQTCAYALILTGVYALVLTRALKRARWSYVWPLLLMGLGLSLAAVQILPTLELLRNSMRATASYDFFSSFSMPPRFALTLFAPYLFGGGNGLLFRAPYVGPTFFGEYVAYVGLLPVMLSIIAISFRPDARTKFWAIVFAVCLLLAFGRFLPFHSYAVIYYVPVLNLFRVPARHLMEVEFAVAVLAGRGLTTINRRRTGSTTLGVAIVSFVVLVLTCLTVTWWRPAEFHLGRQAPLTLMRAPELFVPIFMAVLSGLVLWWFSKSKSHRAGWLLLVLLLDLTVYGQGSGWRTNSPTRESELWRTPESVQYLRSREGNKEGSYRILTEDQRFDPSVPVPPGAPPGDWVFALQPDVYMMHGIENAAGYDGFGLARYSRLAGDMKVWGQLTEPERTLRGDSRELDLLNVRYLLTRPLSVSTNNVSPASSAASGPASTTSAISPADFPQAAQVFGGLNFAAEDLNLSRIDSATKLSFSIPPVDVDKLAMVSNLSWSVDVPDETVVARVRLFSANGKTFDFDVRAGSHTAEWAHDRSDIQVQIKHRRPPVATSYNVENGRNGYEAHSYVCSFKLPQRATIKGGEISLMQVRGAPDLSLTVLRLSLVDEASAQTFPLRREWFSKRVATPTRAGREVLDGSKPATHATNANRVDLNAEEPVTPTPTERWHRLTQFGNVVVFENTRALPRAWLASEVRSIADSEMVDVIRTAKFRDGQPWDPKRTALLESPFEFTTGLADSSAIADILVHEPNRVTIKTKSAAPAVLVLSENHYPGWHAYVDGRRVDVLRVDYNLRGVVLTAGKHKVEFLYRPTSVYVGLIISLLTLVGLLLWWRPASLISIRQRLISRAWDSDRLKDDIELEKAA